MGAFGVTVAGKPTPAGGWSRRSAATLVKVLALAPGHRLHREQVMDLLWPDESPASCAPKLHKAAHYARRAAGREDAVALGNDVVRLFPDAELTVDAVRFEELAREAARSCSADRAREALGWCRGDLLPDDRYDDWVADRRERLHLRRLDMLRLAGEWRELTELDPVGEAAHVQLMMRQLADGDAAAAHRQYARLERVLDRELGVAPAVDARVLALQAELRQLDGRRRVVLAALAELTALAPAAA